MSTLTVGTISEKVTDAGVAVDGVTLKDGGATFTSAVGVTGNTTITSGNLVIGTSGNGIDFSANSNASGMTSELLSSYEEGTWTPEVADAGTGGNTGTYSSGYSHRYIKIGRLVMVTFSLFNINTSGMTGSNTLFIRGLPFGGFSSEQYATNNLHMDVINTTNTGATISGEITSIGIFMDVNPRFRIFQYYDRGLASVKVQDLSTGTADILGNLTYYTS